jgi:hypothetical protein
MHNQSRLIFIVLTVCGTLCILGALTFVGLMYNGHAPAMSVANHPEPQKNLVSNTPTYRGPRVVNNHEFPTDMVSFGVFVMVPALTAILAGGWMVATGVRIGQKPLPELPVQESL